MKKNLVVSTTVLFAIFAIVNVTRAQPCNTQKWQKFYRDEVAFGAVGIVNEGKGYVFAELNYTGWGAPEDVSASRISKIDSAGNLLWNGNFIKNMEVAALKKFANGYVIAGITYRRPGGNAASIRLIRMDTSGSIVWDKVYVPGDSSRIVNTLSMEVSNPGTDVESAVVLVGSQNPQTGTQKPYVFSVDIFGTMTWEHFYDLGYFSQIPFPTYCGIKNVPGGYAFAVNAKSSATSGLDEFFLMKISSTGDSIWHTPIPGQVLNFAPVKATGNILVATRAGYTTVNGNGAVLSNCAGPKESSVMMISSYQSDSNIIEIEQFSTMFSSSWGVNSIHLRELGGSGAAHWLYSRTGNINPDTSYNTLGDVVAASTGGGYVICGAVYQGGINRTFVMKIVHTHTSAVEEVAEPFEAEMYPNPATDHFTVSFKGEYVITITDMKGAIVKRQTGRDITDIERGNLSSGLYIISLQTDGGMLQRKLLFH